MVKKKEQEEEEEEGEEEDGLKLALNWQQGEGTVGKKRR